MGQHASKSDIPIIFGYINQQQEQEEENTLEISHDVVLDHPHLYQLELSCHHCSKQINANCPLHQNLVHDLDYIDKTYYPDMIHYIKHDEEEGDTDTLKDEEGWSKLTIGEINPKNRLVSSLVIDVSNKSLFKLSSSIGHLNNLTKLDLSKNQLIYLPETLGQLVNLRVLNASKNQLEYLPDSITILPKLKALNVSHNKLSTLPQGIGSLPSLIVLILNHNQFTHLPREIAKLKGMITLNVSHNPLCSIPAEIATLKSLRKLTVEGCSFKTEFMHTRAHDPPRLVEICARQIVKYQIPYPSHLSDYFSRQQTCSFCSGPYFDSFVTRGRFVQRSGRQWIALDERLCCAHWIDEQDRISALFSAPYQPTDPIPRPKEKLPACQPLLSGYSSEDGLNNLPVLPINEYAHEDLLQGEPSSRESSLGFKQGFAQLVLTMKRND